MREDSRCGESVFLIYVWPYIEVILRAPSVKHGHHKGMDMAVLPYGAMFIYTIKGQAVAKKKILEQWQWAVQKLNVWSRTQVLVALSRSHVFIRDFLWSTTISLLNPP